MRMVRFQKSRYVVALLFGILSWGMLFAEIHGIFGHAHAILADSGNSGSDSLSDPHVFRCLNSGPDCDNHYCGLCYCYRLIIHSLVPQTVFIIDASFNIQQILLDRIGSLYSQFHRLENRGPPRA